MATKQATKTSKQAAATTKKKSTKTTTKQTSKRVGKAASTRAAKKVVVKKTAGKVAVAKSGKRTKATTKQAVKKTTKSTAKKTSASKTASKKKVLVCAEGAQCFWVSDGQVIKDLLELRDAITAMADDVFAYHAGGEQNDFAAWVREVLQDVECAAALEQSQTKRGTKTIINRHLKCYDC